MALAQAREIGICDAIVTEIAAIAGSAAIVSRTWSFGFSDAELATLRIPVRPWDTAYNPSQRDIDEDDEEDNYEIQIGFQRIVTRKDVAGIDAIFNLMAAVADLYSSGKKMTVNNRVVNVLSKRWFPMMLRSQDSSSGTVPGVMDSATVSQTPLMASLIVTIEEVVSTP